MIRSARLGPPSFRGGEGVLYLHSMKLTQKKCIPCEDKSIKPFTRPQAKEYAILVPEWTLAKNAQKISRTVMFPDFVQALKFVNRVGKLAEREGHHPDISIHYNQVSFELWTHSIKGLSENDFILAAKINALNLH